MNHSTALAASLFIKIEEQINLTGRLVALVPTNRLDYRPVAGAFRFDELLGHLLDACAGFCAALYALKPEELAHFAALRELPVNHRCGTEEAKGRLDLYRTHIGDGFALLTDADLVRRVPTVFAPDGETALTILLWNLEHLINHKHQLFFCLKIIGIEVGTPQLYEIRAPQTN